MPTVPLDLDDYVAGGYLLSRLVGPDWTGTRLRRVTVAEDHSPRRCFPDSWTLSWTSTPREERIAAAAVFGIAERDLDRVRDGLGELGYVVPEQHWRLGKDAIEVIEQRSGERG